ncbi:MAG: hypothetical protein Unbinned7794contig1000_51 [Prokaryotic dsDNA virus sp.]|nr:MAG: hypothetical protein Unbinned7794contig1000_51 [Prokaryotic dsDNA virus sp.]|tara:strand:+ start:3687 stop:3863 length:177 start_codon:yes stop_codon:yes gene_type:complete
MSKLFGAKKTPTPEPEPVAPIPDEDVARLEQEKDYQRRYGGKGRTGTVLTGASNNQLG